MGVLTLPTTGARSKEKGGVPETESIVKAGVVVVVGGGGGVRESKERRGRDPRRVPAFWLSKAAARRKGRRTRDGVHCEGGRS